ncbi:ABC transporter permease [Mariprofundus erugo]|uniref:ABC transporter permease n=1 Tax=Mariprofundus erugo TaxID=2528639 RepID=A0A5R9GMF5_9PROT|nr:ABC transporter permease [Mariprofundus erugo]TLS66159.1 ABC transporter permease [Mariprofundus erugo]
MSSRFSWSRLAAIAAKEFIQMRRDRMTFAMMIGIPVLQLILFGYAINTDPRALPTALLAADSGPYVRSLMAGLHHSGYFNTVALPASEAAASELLDRGEVQFVISIPADFERKLLRGEQPVMLVEADATDPIATASALAVLPEIAAATAKEEGNPLRAPPFTLSVHKRYNPEGESRYNIVPGLMGVILTMTMVMITAVAITRERERGTMEYLLATSVTPIELMLGKIIPYIFVGYVQITLILLAAMLFFHVPVVGSLPLMYGLAIVFILANLCMGITFSTLAANQMQALQMSFFFFLPSILLSGFMFPFRGMPQWAQMIGEVLPLTHFLRLVRGIMLKGNTLPLAWEHLWPIMVFTLFALLVALKRFHKTLD